MSIERRRTSKGQLRYVIRWREHGKNRARSFIRRADALGWDAEVTRRRRMGSLGMLDKGKTTLSALHDEWWPTHVRDIAPKTASSGAGAWRVHLEPHLGKHGIGSLDPLTVEKWAVARLDAGAGEASVEKAWILLGQMLGRAEAWGWIPANPVRLAKRPKKKNARREPRILSPVEIEKLRRFLPARDSALVAVLGYAGLRPGEALALGWGDVETGHIVVEKALSMGEIRSTKTGKSRRVPLIAPLASDLRSWRLASKHSGDDDPVFPNFQGGRWTESDWRMWGGRFFRPALASAKIEGTIRPYDLRHSYVSMLIASGLNPIEVARRAGHSASMTLDVYGHVFEQFEGKGPIDLEATIRDARRAA